MKTPVFEEWDPSGGCDCLGCVRAHPAVPQPSRPGPGSRVTARQALALAAVTGTVLGAGQWTPAVAAAHAPVRPGAPASEQPPQSPQGHVMPLHGPGGPRVLAALPATTRAAIINRAKKWVAAKVPYSMDDYWSDGYRQDCSGFVSMAWNLGTNEWTGSLDKFGVRITKAQLQPGDMLLFHNPANPEKGSHVVLFGGWTDYAHLHYTAYEETPPKARKLTTPYAYWSNSSRYVPYRYKNLTGKKAVEGKDAPLSPGEADLPDAVAGAGGAVAGPGTATPYGLPGFPGPGVFRPGAEDPHVFELGRQLVRKGFGRHYEGGPGPRWGEMDRRNVEAFQQAQGWSGRQADGYPGPETWRRLFS
ncbi:peptidoglycan-binding protein [Streptomyces sp. NPDC048664]|uniref:peptidoglycan-binding protein n=1 Tax=Streptomyces sp. NPDC048664 TaxID=3154505 RepID=UPI0034326DA4